ncbi:hypothetical protein DNTS_023049 [Danionella cerebrum]|uniref:EML-like second beta-propeller domain-containing protein n=1 Tax=Danionella cerebrum TaxID=2873325 RepID=A0A553Q596_9TELE|nr:hypothetical protein DNTS_023049 [Danionella translucida]
MSTAVAQSHVFGLRAAVKNNLLFLDEQTIIFPCGNNCVRYNIDTKQQKFIPGTERSQGMQALALSADRRYLAVSERVEKATISVVDLHQEQNRRRRVLTGGENPVEEFVCMAFSPDSKFLIGQAGGPDWTLFLWMWEKKKVLATVKTSNSGPVHQVSFNPQDNTQICVAGSGVFKIFSYAAESLKQLKTFKTDSHNFLCHTWLSAEQVLAGTQSGQLMLFESGRLRWEIGVTPVLRAASSSEERGADGSRSAPPQISSIVAYSNGFACSAGPGTVCLFERTENEEHYRRSKDIEVPPGAFTSGSSISDQQEISSLVLSPSEETLVASTDLGQLYSIHLSLVELHKTARVEFEFLSQSFHHNIITGLSTCIRKPLIATSSLDCSVRIWNFETHVLEMTKEFPEEAYSVALHPSGLYVLVGFSDKLRLMTLLMDDMTVFKEFPIRSCRECTFSHGGHLFAAVNGNVIILFSTTTLEDVRSLKGHNEKVRGVVFSADDSRLVSCGMDGAVYEWNTLSGALETDSVLKTSSYTGVAVSPDGKTFFAVATDCALREIQDCQILREMPSGDVVCTTVAVSRSGRAIFMGTSAGSVRVVRYPLPIQNQWLEFQAHAAPVTKMVITFDEQFLLSVSEDASLFIWRIIDQEEQGLKREKELIYSEETLITKSELEEKNKLILELSRRVEELEEDKKSQLSLQQAEYRKKIAELSETFLQQITSLNHDKEVLKKEKHTQRGAHAAALLEISKKQQKELEDIESANIQKLMLEYEKYQELHEKLHRIEREHEQQLRRSEESKSRELTEMMEAYEAKLEEKLTLLKQCQSESQQRVREFEEYIRQQEEDADSEILQIASKYEFNLRAEKEDNSRLKVELQTRTKQFQELQRDIESRNLENEKLKQELHKLQAVIRSLEGDIQGLKITIQGRDGIIQNKVSDLPGDLISVPPEPEATEKDIIQLKKENNVLKKKEEVTNYQTEHMQEQIEPKQKEIEELNEQIQEMKGELEEFLKSNTQLELNIAELSLKLKAKDKEMHRESVKAQSTGVLLQRFRADLLKCVESIQEPKKLKESVRELHKCYAQPSDTGEKEPEDPDTLQEHSRQREHYEKIISTLKNQLSRDAKIFQASKLKLMKEHVALSKELSALREELQSCRSSINARAGRTDWKHESGRTTKLPPLL